MTKEDLLDLYKNIFNIFLEHTKENCKTDLVWSSIDLKCIKFYNETHKIIKKIHYTYTNHENEFYNKKTNKIKNYNNICQLYFKIYWDSGYPYPLIDEAKFLKNLELKYSDYSFELKNEHPCGEPVITVFIKF